MVLVGFAYKISQFIQEVNKRKNKKNKGKNNEISSYHSQRHRTKKRYIIEQEDLFESFFFVE